MSPALQLLGSRLYTGWFRAGLSQLRFSCLSVAKGRRETGIHGLREGSGEGSRGGLRDGLREGRKGEEEKIKGLEFIMVIVTACNH